MSKLLLNQGLKIHVDNLKPKLVEASLEPVETSRNQLKLVESSTEPVEASTEAVAASRKNLRKTIHP